MRAPLTQATEYPSVEEAGGTSSAGATSYEKEDVLTLGSISAALSAHSLKTEEVKQTFSRPDQTPPPKDPPIISYRGDPATMPATYNAQYDYLNKQESVGEAL